jgi:exosortase A
VLALFSLFHAEAVAALKVWNESTAFGHCYLVLPIAGWLAWERRAGLAGLPAEPLPWLGLLALPLAFVWLAANCLGFMEGRQFAVLGLLWLLVVATLGLRIGRVFATPLAYLIFLVPFGDFLVPSLQDFTASFIDGGLNLLGIPHVVTATFIEIPEGNFRVAEACAGLRFLIAAVAFGTLYGCLLYRSPARRIAFIAVCVVAPVLANGIRALGIVVVGHIKGSAEAGAVDHILYGWLFFSIVIVLLLVLGLPFRQDQIPRTSYTDIPSIRPVISRSQPIAAAVAAIAVLLPAAGGPAAASLLEQRARAQTAALLDAVPDAAAQLVAPAGCAIEPPTANPGQRRFACGGAVLTAQTQLFSEQAGSTILTAWRDAAQWESSEDIDRTWLDLPAGQWQMAETHKPDRNVAVALWMNSRPVRPSLGLRLHLALALFGATPDGLATARLVTVNVTPSDQYSRARLTEFATAQPAVPTRTGGR